MGKKTKLCKNLVKGIENQKKFKTLITSPYALFKAKRLIEKIYFRHLIIFNVASAAKTLCKS